MSLHVNLQVLRAKIRGFESTGRTISSRIHKSEGIRKNRLWNQKRQLGWFSRHHLVAYGLLKGLPYERIERCHPNNKLNAKLVLDIMLAHNGYFEGLGYRTYDLEKVELLLVVSATEASATSSTQAPAPVPTAASTTPRSMSGLLASSRPIATLKRLLEKRA